MQLHDHTNLSKQQLKSLNTKHRIFRATKVILQNQGYEHLSIKNICEEAGVSNGSFFHQFKTKEDLLSYYMKELPGIDPDLLDLPDDSEEVKIALIHIYLGYAECCRELGIEFMTNYYTPKNQSLDLSIPSVENYLHHAVESQILSSELSISKICTDIRILVIGNLFEWCRSDGVIDLEGNIRRSLTHYLDGIF